MLTQLDFAYSGVALAVGYGIARIRVCWYGKLVKTRITNPGYLPVPMVLSDELHLEPGYSVFWEKISDNELRVKLVPPAPTDHTPETVLDIAPMVGFGYQHGLVDKLHMSSDEYMREMREGENDDEESVR